MEKKITTDSVAQTHAVAEQFIAQNTHRIVAFYGDLGSGKTTFVQGILRACGAHGPYTSPTFTIIKEYEDCHCNNFHTIYHIDAYRIKSDDMIELGWKDMIANPHALVIIEWAENIADLLLHENVQKITCTWTADTRRTYTFH